MKHIGTKPIETPRLLLRRFTPADAEDMFHTWASDPEVTRFLRFAPHPDIEESKKILRQWEEAYQKDDQYLWCIVLKETGRPIGSIAILPGTEAPPPIWEPGYCIGRAFWGKGYTTEALQAVMDYFVLGTGQTNLHCYHAIANPASGRVMEKAGFVYHHEGVYHKPDGTEIPAKFYSYTPAKEQRS